MHEEIVRSIIKSIKEEAFSNSHFLKKIQRIVDIITKNLSVDVCSIYILNKDNKFELYATEGLSKDAVNKTVLNFNEGLIGQIAKAKKTLSFENIWNNEHFSYRPETAEDPYYTLMGTPIVAHDTLLGILVIQNKSPHTHETYHKDVIEITSLILSRLFLNTVLYSSLNDSDLSNEIEFSIDFLSPGKADGKIVFHHESLFKYFGESSNNEHLYIETIKEKLIALFDESDKNYFELFQKQFNWLERVKRYVRDGIVLSVAFLRVFEELSFLLEGNFMQTMFLKKFTDFAMIEAFNISIKNIRNNEFLSSEDLIIVAESITPFMFFYYINSGVKGFILEKITPYDYVSNIAKSFNIPIVTGIDRARESFKSGEYVILDSEKSSIRISSNRDFYEKNRNINYSSSLKNNIENDLLSLPKVNEDSNFYLTIGTVADLDKFESLKNFKGVGIFRQEVFFGNLGYIPNPIAQSKYYKEVFSKIDNENIFVDFFHINSEIINNKFNKNQRYYLLGSLIESQTVIYNYLKPLIESLGNKKLGLLTTANISSDIFRLNEIIMTNIKDGSFYLVPTLSMPSTVIDTDCLYKDFNFLTLDINVLVDYFYSSCFNHNFKKYHIMTLPFLKILKSVVEITRNCNKRCAVMSCTGIDDPLLLLVLQYIGFKDIFISLHFNVDGYKKLFEMKEQIFEIIDNCFEENIYDVKKAIKVKI